MNRENPYNSTDSVIVHDNLINSVISDFSTKEPKIVVIDGDSIPFICSYTGRNELGEKNPEYLESEYHLAEGLVTEWILKIINNCQEYYDVKGVYICLKGKNNFRNGILETYKQHRTESLPIVKHLHKYIVENHSGIEAPSGEADDLVKTIAKASGYNTITCGIDKDLKVIEGIHYDYKKDVWSKVTKDEGLYNFWSQVIKGDSSDFRGLSPGIGDVWVKKNLRLGMSDFDYKKAAIIAYRKAWKGDEKKAKEMLKVSYCLVHLYDIEHEEFKLPELTTINNY